MPESMDQRREEAERGFPWYAHLKGRIADHGKEEIEPA
jgi:hypothetical protein